jgi:cell division protein FtsL
VTPASAASPQRRHETPRRHEHEAEQPRQREFRVFTAEERRARAQRFRARVLLGMSASVLAVAGLVVGVSNVVVTSRQFRVDSLSSAVSSAVAENQNLQLQRSQLESPGRIISIAEHRLGMVMPKSVTYLPAQPLPAAPASKTKGGAHGGGRAPAR